MVDLDHLPLIGRFAAWSSVALDVILNSGDFVFVLFGFLADNFALLYSAVRTLESLAQRLPWLPAGVLDDLVTAVLVAALVIYGARLAKRGASNI